MTAAPGPRPRHWPDLRSAGRELASHLHPYRERDDAVVLALVRGGVPAGAEIASALSLPIDVVVIARMLAPYGPDDPIGAATIAGKVIVDDGVPPIQIPPSGGIDHYLVAAFEALRTRTSVCRGERDALDVRGRTVLLVDNGARTGKTMRAAIRGLRKCQPARIVAAVAAASRDAEASLAGTADEVVTALRPDPFGNVAMWYSNFDVPQDSAIAGVIWPQAP
ncbi:MAG TPA: phosphoribosyltransferase family protein [Thermoanaerobaculia bacterium]|nr:phosphoribosyltransferase family protein [Thermoanaerobaculia bacterium]